MDYLLSGFPRLLESNLKFKVPESPEIYLWFNLTNVPIMYSTPCVNKCTKYSCCVLTEQFLCDWRWTFCDGLYRYTVYTE